MKTYYMLLYVATKAGGAVHRLRQELSYDPRQVPMAERQAFLHWLVDTLGYTNGQLLELPDGKPNVSLETFETEVECKYAYDELFQETARLQREGGGELRRVRRSSKGGVG